MKIFKLASAVAVLILFASPDLILMGSVSRAASSNTLPSVVVDQSLALFMPAGYQIATEVVTSHEGGC